MLLMPVTGSAKTCAVLIRISFLLCQVGVRIVKKSKEMVSFTSKRVRHGTNHLLRQKLLLRLVFANESSQNRTT